MFTSNIGSAESMRMESAPFASVERTVLMRVHERLRPELLGRIDETLVFSRLSYPVQRQICEDLINLECQRLAALGHHLEVSPGAVEFLVRKGYHRTLGARPMRSTVERYLQEAVVVAILAGASGCGRLAVDVSQNGLVLDNLSASTC